MPRSNQFPASATEKRNGVICERLFTGGAVHWKQQARGLPEDIHHHWRLLAVEIRGNAGNMWNFVRKPPQPVKVVASKGGMV